MSGSEFVTILKRVVPAVPVIMLTACGSVDTYFKSRISGVFEYINKPVKVTELRLIVKAALDWSEAHHSSTGS
jgi:DNA-binding NtrC family response regulator